MTTATPLACTLAPGEYADRVRWIADLNRAALRAHARDGLSLVLTYAPAAAAQIRALAEREGRCCAFLTFRIDETPGAVRLTVVAPEAAASALDAVFAPLLSGVEGAPPDRPPASARGATAEDPGAACAGMCGCATAAATGAPSCAPAPVQLTSARGGRLPATAATTAAAAAVACGVCCVLPVALPAVALTAAGGVIGAFAGAYRWALDTSVALTAAGWLWVAWRSIRGRRRPDWSTVRAMTLATLLAAVALSWPRIEPIVRHALTARVG